MDPESVCKSGLANDPASRDKTCIPANDPASRDKTCIPVYDPASRDKACIPNMPIYIYIYICI